MKPDDNLNLFELKEVKQESLYFETLEDWQKHIEQVKALEME